jgi:hypothetical protein
MRRKTVKKQQNQKQGQGQMSINLLPHIINSLNLYRANPKLNPKMRSNANSKTKTNTRSNTRMTSSPHFYMFSQKVYKKNNKVIENITQEVKNNKMYTKGYLYGKKINKTQKLF